MLKIKNFKNVNLAGQPDNRSSSKGKRIHHKRASLTDHKSKKGPKPKASKKSQHKGKPKVVPSLPAGSPPPAPTLEPWRLIARQARWMPSYASLDKLQHWDTLCLKPEIPIAGRLTHFLPFWKEVIQANCWVLEIIHQGYSIEVLWIP